MRELRSFDRSALIAAGIGVLGQIVILWHALVHTYPFKMMTYPPWQFYRQLGYFGSLGVLLATGGLALIIRRKTPLLCPLLLTSLAPLLYAVIVFLVTIATYGSAVPSGTRNFDDYTVAQATTEFARAARELAIGGIVVGGFCSVVLTVAKRGRTKSSTA